MKFSDLRKNRRRPVKKVPFPILLDPSEPPEVFSVGLRCLGGGESAEVLSKAAELAREGGSKNPEAGDPLFELGQRAYTVLFAAVDPDHPEPESEDARFFASIDELLERDQSGASPLIGRDGISFLFEAQESWESQCSAQLSHLSETEAWAKVKEVAESEDPLVFVNMQPALQWSLARFMARRLLILANWKSGSGSNSETSTTKPSKKAPKKKASKS